MTSGRREKEREEPGAKIGVYEVVKLCGKNSDGKILLQVVCTNCSRLQVVRKADALRAERRGSDTCKHCANELSEMPATVLSEIRRRLRKRDMEKRGLPCSVSAPYLRELFTKQGGCCAYTGVKLSFRGDKTASLDRIDSAKGYEPGNVQWVHKAINVAKHVLSHEEFIAMCIAVAKKWSKDTGNPL